MSEHRVRLTDEDVEMIVRGLRCRAAMTNGLRRHRIERLCDRMSDMARGNPKWRLDEMGQTHEEDMDDEFADD